MATTSTRSTAFRKLRALCWVSWAMMNVACSSHFNKGEAAYHEARYPTAMGELIAAEADEVDSRGAAPARYILYRGLAHLAVGDSMAAEHWLGQAKDLLDREPRSFSREDQGRLTSAWRALGRPKGRGRAGPAWLAGQSR